MPRKPSTKVKKEPKVKKEKIPKPEKSIEKMRITICLKNRVLERKASVNEGTIEEANHIIRILNRGGKNIPCIRHFNAFNEYNDNKDDIKSCKLSEDKLKSINIPWQFHYIFEYKDGRTTNEFPKYDTSSQVLIQQIFDYLVIWVDKT